MTITWQHKLTYPARWLLAEPSVVGRALLIFFASAFVVAPNSLWAIVFYAGILPVLLYGWRRDGWRIDWHQPYLWLCLAIMVWSGLSLLWGEDPGKGRITKYGFGCVLAMLYWLSLLAALQHSPGLSRRIGTILILCGVLNAVWSMLYFYGIAPQDRFGGWAETRHPILGALVMILPYAFALQRLLYEPTHKIWHGLVVLLCLTFIILTTSRGPYITVFCVTLLICSGLPVKVWLQRLPVLLAIGGFGLAVMWLVHQGWLTSATQVLAERGMSYRLDIWNFTLSRIVERPWFGHGAAAYLGMKDFTFPHSLYLSTLFFTGIIGLGLLLSLFGWSMLWLIRHWRKRPDSQLLAALLCVPMIGGLTDLGQLTPTPATIWLVLWLPIALITAQMSAVRSGQHNPQ